MSALLAALAFCRPLQHRAIAPVPGDLLAPFTIQRLDAVPFSWKPGRVTLVTFCAYWCDTWREHLKRVEQARRSLSGLPIDALAISVDGRWTELVGQAQLPELILLKDPDGRWSTDLGVRTVPFTMIVDADGCVRWSGQGVLRSEDMAEQLREAFGPRHKGGPVYLTFDDFPKADSENLLDLLRAEHVPATFFCVCSRAVANKDVLQRAVREGHALEIHAWNHDETELPLARCVLALKAAANWDATLLRRAGSEKIVGVNGAPLNAYDVDPYDFERPSEAELLRRVLHALRPGCVIQLHSGVVVTLRALPEIIREAKREGYEFAKLANRKDQPH